MAARSRSERARRRVESGRATSVVERELVEMDIDSYKADVFTAAGDGSVGPTLPTAVPEELYDEFEHDEEPPRDVAP